MTKTTLSRTLRAATAGTVALLPFLAFSGQANATAIAYSALTVENFQLTNTFGGFDSFQFISRPITASVSGVGADFEPQQTCNTEACTLDIQQVVVGTAPWAANNQYHGANAPTLGDAQSNDFAVGDSFMTDTTILDANGGDFGAQSAAGVSGGSAGSSATGADNKMFWNFEADAGTVLDFTFDYALDLFAETTVAGETAGNGVSFKVQLLNSSGNTVIQEIVYFDLEPGISANNSPFAYDLSESGTDSGQFIIADAGTYGFNIIFDTSADATSAQAQNVPEPGTLALLGLGLLGMGAAYRRRKHTAA